MLSWHRKTASNSVNQNVNVRKKSPEKNTGEVFKQKSPKRHVSIKQDKDLGVIHSQEVSRLEGGPSKEVDLQEGNFN